MTKQQERLVEKWEATGLLDNLKETKENSTMAILLESTPYQPLEEDTEEKRRVWAERALPLVRRVFKNFYVNNQRQVK